MAPAELLDDVFHPAGADGAGMLEVGVPLQEAFHALAAVRVAGFAEAARTQALTALERASKRMGHEADVARLERAARPLLGRSALEDQSPAEERALAKALP